MTMAWIHTQCGREAPRIILSLCVSGFCKPAPLFDSAPQPSQTKGGNVKPSFLTQGSSLRNTGHFPGGLVSFWTAVPGEWHAQNHVKADRFECTLAGWAGCFCQVRGVGLGGFLHDIQGYWPLCRISFMLVYSQKVVLVCCWQMVPRMLFS